MHCLPAIGLAVGSHQALFQKRCVGLFAGSRSAAAAGRLPLLDVAAHSMSEWRINALQVNGSSFCLATFVDNLVTIAESPEKAVHIMTSCEKELWNRWYLKIGADSKGVYDLQGISVYSASPGRLDTTRHSQMPGPSPRR